MLLGKTKLCWLPRLAVLDCDGVQREIKFFNGIESTPVNKAIPLGKLNRVHVPARQLRCFRFRFVRCRLQIAEVETMTLAAQKTQATLTGFEPVLPP